MASSMPAGAKPPSHYNGFGHLRQAGPAGWNKEYLYIQLAVLPSARSLNERPTMYASGTFDVKITPQAPTPGFEAAQLGRMTLDKQFHGELSGASLGEMLAMRTAVDGSAGYVAMERVTGTLGGRSGSFALQHSGTMTRGAKALTLTVVPDSGTGELTGLTGAMAIDIEQGQHRYVMEYSLAAPAQGG